MSDTDTSSEAVERLAAWYEGKAWPLDVPCPPMFSAPWTAATLRALLAERDHYGSTADARAVCITMLERERDAARARLREMRETAATFQRERDAARAEAARLREALQPFARIWRINAGLNPHPALPVARFIAGAWPVMDDARRAAELLAAKEPGHD